jgi:hypothetical protein
MSQEVSTFRLYLMRALYLLNFIFGFIIWPGILRHENMSDPLQAVAISFWAALFTLSGLGIRYPLKMLPLLFMQLFYKTVWLISVALPLWSAGRSTDLTGGMILGVVLDLIVIPWSYVLTNFVKMRGDRWR